MDENSNRVKLSAKQAKILTFIEKQTTQNGRSPTYRDIAKHCGYEAIGTVQDHIQALVRKGFLKKDAGVARGIQLAYRSESKDIPILGVVPAGKPIEAIESSLGSLSIPAGWKGDLYALKVKGDSMIEAGILEGDLVIVKKQNHAEDGEVIVALIDGEATVKILEKKTGHVRLLPANSRYSPIELQEHAENLIHGKVVALHRYFVLKS